MLVFVGYEEVFLDQESETQEYVLKYSMASPYIESSGKGASQLSVVDGLGDIFKAVTMSDC